MMKIQKEQHGRATRALLDAGHDLATLKGAVMARDYTRAIDEIGTLETTLIRAKMAIQAALEVSDLWEPAGDDVA